MEFVIQNSDINFVNLNHQLFQNFPTIDDLTSFLFGRTSQASCCIATAAAQSFHRVDPVLCHLCHLCCFPDLPTKWGSGLAVLDPAIRGLYTYYA